MGKYMRKTGDVAVMEVVSKSSSPSSYPGVRTRAKTLALQGLQSESSYLQLRNRRLEKASPLLTDTKKQSSPKDCGGNNPNPSRRGNPSSGTNSRLRIMSMNSGSNGSVSIGCSKDEGVIVEIKVREGKENGAEDCDDLDVEPSFGENNLDFDCRERGTRESTPCSLIRELDGAGTPGSTTRQTGSTAIARRIRNSIQRNIPTVHDVEEFFTNAEQQQQRLFMEKYNFDVMNDCPLPGRYEWVSV